jgi:hypothetical protein
VEPCWSFDVHRNRETKQLDLVQRSRKCLFVYQYWQHPELGWMNARIQTWFPFSIQICLNGREWLAQKMRQQGIGFQQQDNCFVWIEDWAGAQRLVSILRQSRRLSECWPLKGACSQSTPRHPRAKLTFTPQRFAVAWQSLAQHIEERCRANPDSRKCQTSTASPAEPGDLPTVSR